jgi:hypothetical protein
MILKDYTKLYRDEYYKLDRYTRLPKPEMAIEVSDWLIGNNAVVLRSEADRVRFIANRWNMTDKQAQRLLNVLTNQKTGQIEQLLVG